VDRHVVAFSLIALPSDKPRPSQPLKTLEVDALVAERAKELQSIELLQRDKANLVKGIERLRDEADKKTKAVRSAIQKAFANTRARELESLGELAVFEALLSRRPEPTPAATARESEAPDTMYRADCWRDRSVQLDLVPNLLRSQLECFSLSCRIKVSI
jgi:hypothetical protein